MSHAGDFPELRFLGELRPTQKRAVSRAVSVLDSGERRLHLVAPPGSGKTILGLYLWARHVRRPAVVLCPNSAIQAQWVERLSHFEHAGAAGPSVGSTTHESSSWLTALTYQALTLPGRGDVDVEARATELWRERLVQEGEARDDTEASAWIEDLSRHAADYYDKRFSTYRKLARDEKALSGGALDTLHDSSREAIDRLRERGAGMIIADECHHLLGHWGRVLAELGGSLGDPVVLGLTATPPDRKGRRPEDLARHDDFLGPVVFEVPTPALVKEGFLAPYQDLCYFVRPQVDELRFIAKADEDLLDILGLLRGERPDAEGLLPLDTWLQDALATHQLGARKESSSESFDRRHPAFAQAARLFLRGAGLDLPPGIPTEPAELGLVEGSDFEVQVTVLEYYIRFGLRRSSSPGNKEVAALAMSRLRVLGVQVTETGWQPCASPVSRVMSCSRAKAVALKEILKTEHRVLGDRIRAVVVTDFERSAATRALTGDVLDGEAGGAIAAFRTLVEDEETDLLDPILVTGATVMVDDDLVGRFLSEAKAWLAERKLEVELEDRPSDGFHCITGVGAAWCPRHYVSLITELFQRGVTRCLVGTRGLLGEGWDANKINVLVDLTSVTTSMSVKQLRGRSLRLDPDDPDKVPNNWDVICVAGEFAKGLTDYERFEKKHEGLWGLTDDGAIEKGVGHVHPAFTRLRPEGLEGALNIFNEDMLRRAGRRDTALAQWRVGEPFEGRARATAEIGKGGGGGGFPPFAGRQELWTEASLVEAVGRAILEALVATEQVRNAAPIKSASRAGGALRVFLSGGDAEASALFTTALKEALGPLDRPRYVIPRFVDERTENWLSRLLPELLARYVRRSERKQVMLHAVPSCLASKRELVDEYQAAWNRHVSPGEACYAHRGEGEELVLEARRAGLTPGWSLREKTVYV